MDINKKIQLLKLLTEVSESIDENFTYTLNNGVATLPPIENEISNLIHSIDDKLNGLYAVALNKQ